MRQRADEVVAAGSLGGRFDFLPAGIAFSIGDILRDRAGKQPGVLQHHADPPAQGLPSHRRDGLTVDRDHAAVQFVEPHQKID